MKLSAALALGISGGCGGSGSSDDATLTPDSTLTARRLTSSEISLATRVCQTQLANGFWNFEHPWYEPINYASPGFQNIVGVTADGLLNVYAIDRADTGQDSVAFVPMCVAEAKDALLAFCDTFVANPTTAPRPSLSNFVFLGRYRDIVGMTLGEQTRARNALMLRLTQDDLSHGTANPAVIIDGWLNLIAAARASIPGIIGWDTAFSVKVILLWALPPADLAYAVSFLKLQPIDSTVEYGLLSAAHVLEVLNMPAVHDVSVNPQLRTAIEDRAVGDGSYTDASGGTGPGYQASAYVLMAYKEILAPQTTAILGWLTGQIRSNGALWDSDTDIENFEINGEVLLAITK
jgi:hypothetical protein